MMFAMRFPADPDGRYESFMINLANEDQLHGAMLVAQGMGEKVSVEWI